MTAARRTAFHAVWESACGGLLSFTSAIWLAIGVIAVIQVFAVATEIVLDVLAQHTVPDHLQGRLITLIMWLHAQAKLQAPSSSPESARARR